MKHLNTFFEAAGFILLVAAAYTVESGLALLVAGVGLIALANAPEGTSRHFEDRRAARDVFDG